MTLLMIRAALSFALPLLAGTALVSMLWPGCPRFLRIGLGTGVGLGLAGTVWMAALTFGGSSTLSLIGSEQALLLVIVAWIRRRTRQSEAHRPDTVKSPPARLALAVLIVCVVCSLVSTAMLANVSPHGGFDGAAIWNTKARFLYLDSRPLAHLGYLVLPDYPLLHPSVIARGWQYSKQNTFLIPIALAAFFTLATVLVLVSGLRRITSRRAALLAGCLAVGTPFWISSGASQYADIVMSFFITSAMVTLCLAHFSEPGTRGLPVLSGLLAGFAMCTKNEGTLFVVAISAAQVLLLLWNRRWQPDGIRFGWFLAGLAPGVLAWAIFKVSAPDSNMIVSNMSIATITAVIGDTSRHALILKGFGQHLASFGEWWLNPLLLMLAYAIVRRIAVKDGGLKGQWLLPTLVLVIMLCGYYGVYLTTPYDVNWHVQSSLSRLLVQIWPSILLAWTLGSYDRLSDFR